MKLVKIIYVLAGFIFLILAIVGVVLPGLPTTPFLLLSAACFFRGSPRLHQWLLYHPLWGKYLRNYYQYKAIPRHVKKISLFVLWLTIGISFYFTEYISLRIILVLVVTGVSIHLYRLKTID